MPLQLAAAAIEDVERIVDIESAAFAPSTLTQVLFPRGSSPDQKLKSKERMLREWKEDASMRLIKVVDSEIGEIIAFAKWNIYRTERPESEWKKRPAREWGDGSNKEACRLFFGAIDESRQRIRGKAHCLLAVLDTDPKHQRRGAGSMLVKWGCEIADDEGIPAYLEATPIGYPVYRRQGFEDVDVVELDFSRWGGEESEKFTAMTRPPRKQ